MNRTRRRGRREKREEKLLNFKSLVALLGSCLAIGTSGQRLPPIHTTPTPKLRRCSSCLRGNQPWANFCTYQQLYEQVSDSDREISFAFCTPTTPDANVSMIWCQLKIPFLILCSNAGIITAILIYLKL